MTWTCLSVSASLSARSPVPSGLLSSTTSRSASGTDSLTRPTMISRFCRSLYVGMTMTTRPVAPGAPCAPADSSIPCIHLLCPAMPAEGGPGKRLGPDPPRRPRARPPLSTEPPGPLPGPNPDSRTPHRLTCCRARLPETGCLRPRLALLTMLPACQPNPAGEARCGPSQKLTADPPNVNCQGNASIPFHYTG